jgi:hypothetical protein
MTQRLPNALPLPLFRRLRAYAFDPSLDTQLETAVVNHVVLKIPWEHDPRSGRGLLKPGPVGEYLEVVDYDPATNCFYAPIDLDDPYLLATDGLAPSEGTPQFHQQMVYAVAMMTIKNFESALGRVALWAPRLDAKSGYHEEFVRRLRIYPHALREANAYYSPEKKSLLFGYFPASLTDPGRNLPGGMVFACLSHDVVAHETTHALLDGLHRRFIEDSNADVPAFHEAFADIVALFQHFTLPEALKHQIEKTRGDLARQNMLGELAQQFGQAIGLHGALRDAIGHISPETHQWEPLAPGPADYQRAKEPHDRGAILVAAVFDAFLAIYRSRITDLLRIATGGAGVLPQGEIHPDLVNRLADEASKSARHILNMCIRALDYCPPVDLTFGDYLRALVTADYDLVPDDPRGYRIAVIEAFRRRGIYPRDVRTLSVESLRWQKPPVEGRLPGQARILRNLNINWDLSAGRKAAYVTMRENCKKIHDWLLSGVLTPEVAGYLGLALGKGAPKTIPRARDGKPAVEVHSVRPARRIGPDGQMIIELVVEITQQRRELLEPANPKAGDFTFRGGCTLLVDLQTGDLRYCITKNILSAARLQRQREFEDTPADPSLYATYFGSTRTGSAREPFAQLHRCGF